MLQLWFPCVPSPQHRDDSFYVHLGWSPPMYRATHSIMIFFSCAYGVGHPDCCRFRQVVGRWRVRARLTLVGSDQVKVAKRIKTGCCRHGVDEVARHRRRACVRKGRGEGEGKGKAGWGGWGWIVWLLYKNKRQADEKGLCMFVRAPSEGFERRG